MSATAPAGLGIFLWQWSQCEGGNVDNIISKAKRCDITWVALHFDNVMPDLVTKFHTARIYVAAWDYCVPGDLSYIPEAKRVLLSGVDAILPDCEIEWETRKLPDGSVVPSDRRPEAILFAQQLRQALGDNCWIGNCGAWQWPDRHPIYPDHAFGTYWDAGLPERYWTMFSKTESAASALDESEKEWADPMNIGAYKSLIPIGSAFDGSAQGGQPLRAADVSDFLDRQETCALWSWQHIPPIIWALLEARASSHVSTLPPPPSAP